MSPRNTFIAAVAVVAITTGTWLSFRVMSPAPLPQTATLLPAPGSLPEFSLVDHDGKAIGADVFSGHWNLVFFGFTHCPDICPDELAKMCKVYELLIKNKIQVLPIFISVDPTRDLPTVVK